MATVTLKGNPVNVLGDLPAVGSKAPAFSVISKDLSELSLSSFEGKKLVLNIYPSVDTGTCAASTRRFNEVMNERDDVVVLCVSQDLPFAFARFCSTENLENIQAASTFRSTEFLTDYGVKIGDGALAGLCARAVVVVDEQGTVVHTELVSEIVNEPNYDAALATLA